MAEYIVEIEGRHPLTQIELQIQSEELGFSEFLSINIGFHNGRVTNLATFKELSPGTTPKQPTLGQAQPGQPAPPGKMRVWAGPMIVDNQAIFVALYRGV